MPSGGGAALLLALLAGGAGAYALIPRHGAAVNGGVAARPRRTPENRVGAVLDAAPNPCILLDARVNVSHANTAALQAFPAMRIGQPMSFALRDPLILSAVSGCLDDQLQRTIELIERVPVERSFACAVAPVETAGRAGKRDATVLLVLRETSKERAVETMRVDFIANASHELRTPLAAIIGFIETLQGPARNDPAARDQFLGIMGDQARRMSRLVDDLLSLSRIELKEHQAPAEQVDLCQILEETVPALSGIARERGVTLHLERPDHPVMVLGERDELVSVFDNLIENAIKYGKAGHKVDVSISAGRDAAVAVRDYGPGIAPDHVPRLTERFYRVDNAASRTEGGTGLGLALVKHTVNRHRGRLSIQSTPGAGATFTVSLPLLASP